MMRVSRLLASFPLLIALPALAEVAASPEAIEFFEKKIRPALVSECAECHGAEKQKGGLRVDSRDALQKGGDTGPAVVPGDPAKSLLLTSIKHLDPDMEMPRKRPKLDAELIASFEKWIADGAADPRDRPPSPADTAQGVLDRAQRLWAFQPLNPSPPPAVRDTGWSNQPIDRFLLAAMEEKQVTPADDSDAATLIRRLTYILNGVPPTPTEVDAFIKNTARDRSSAINSAIDQLLARPEFGETFARHWMDVVRYAETHGSENDEILPEAWQYRDYLIRAFNADVPYDQFVREHLAGDQLAEPRRTEGRNESIIGTAFWNLTEFNQSPVDVKREEATVVENQIDAIGKAFQGLTLSCARCHDHKFDPVLQRDYYALYGIATSSRVTMRQLEDPAIFHRNDEALLKLKAEIKAALVAHWQKDLAAWPQRFDEARLQLHASGSLKVEPDAKVRPPGWLGVFRHPDMTHPDHPLFVMARMARAKPGDAAAFAKEWTKVRAEVQGEEKNPGVVAGAQVIGDFSSGSFGNWFRSGAISKAMPTPAGEWTLAFEGDDIVRSIQPAGFYSNTISQLQGGSLRSPDFVLDGDRVRVLACGERDARLRLVIENFQGDTVLFANAARDLAVPHLRWFDLTIREAWKGRRAYVELMTRDDKPYVGQVGASEPGMRKPTNWRSAFGVVRVTLEKGNERSGRPLALSPEFWNSSPATWEELVTRFTTEAQQALAAWSSNSCDERQAQLLDGLLDGAVIDNRLNQEHPAAAQVSDYRKLEAQIPVATRIPGVIDDPTARDVALQQRGDWKAAKEIVPRSYLAVFGTQACGGETSGRLALAHAIADPKNPLTARVYVNRVWHWLYGRGLVTSVDNFGSLGDVPSHPALLDYLASEFIVHGWSTKWLVRQIVGTRAWQLSPIPNASAHERDPSNGLFAFAPVRRLESEMIRDGILSASGQLRTGTPGQSVPVWLPDTLLDQFRPKSGPLDGNGRRSVYLEIRRNFPTDFLRAFDQPKPSAPVGRRSITTVPAQSLALLNDPFVREQSKRWGEKLAADNAVSTTDRIARMYRSAFARRPSVDEGQRALAYLEQCGGTENAAAWAELAHALFNLKEFIFLR